MLLGPARFPRRDRWAHCVDRRIVAHEQSLPVQIGGRNLFYELFAPHEEAANLYVRDSLGKSHLVFDPTRSQGAGYDSVLYALAIRAATWRSTRRGAAGLALDGSHPTRLLWVRCLWTSITPYFSPSLLAWYERGGAVETRH